MNASVYGPFVKDGIKLYCYMTAYGWWAYYAERGPAFAQGTVEADNRVEAWNLAFDEAKRSMWTGEEILEREG